MWAKSLSDVLVKHHPMYEIFTDIYHIGNLDFLSAPKKSIVTQNEQTSISWLHIRIGFDPFLLDLKIR